MTYTPSPLKAKSVPDNFGNLRTDGSRIAMLYANTFQSQDATASPVTSPVTVNTTTTLTVPQNAVQVTIISVTNAVQISEDSTQSVYFNLPAATPLTLDCANQQYIYLKTGSSTVVSFQFKLI